MSSPGKTEVSERFAEMERMDRRRIWESALKPLAAVSTPERKPDTIALPVEMLVRRLDELERSILNVQKDLQVQVATIHHWRRRSGWKLAGLVLVVAAVVMVMAVPRVVSLIQNTPFATARIGLEDH